MAAINCGKRITCRYHAWTYALDGRLIAVPHRETFEAFDTARAFAATLPG